MGWWQRYSIPVAFVLGAALLVGGSLIYLGVRSRPLEIALATPTPSSGLEVYLEGAVNNPGWYRLTDMAALEEVMRAAGLSPEAERGRLWVRVPFQGGTPSPVQKVNLNTAPAFLLEALPGIGQVRARGIMEAREEAPFYRLYDLVERNLIPLSVLEKIKDLVTVE